MESEWFILFSILFSLVPGVAKDHDPATKVLLGNPV
jgi:hypothetical protein